MEELAGLGGFLGQLQSLTLLGWNKYEGFGLLRKVVEAAEFGPVFRPVRWRLALLAQPRLHESAPSLRRRRIACQE